jgi:hypothetical protein
MPALSRAALMLTSPGICCPCQSQRAYTHNRPGKDEAPDDVSTSGVFVVQAAAGGHGNGTPGNLL